MEANRLTLRDAANIVGFHSYPLGWSWAEYALAENFKAKSYEKKATNAARLGHPNLVVPQPEGAAASRNAENYRRKKIRKKFYEIVAFEQVRLIIFDRKSNGRVANQDELIQGTLRFDFKRSWMLIEDHRERCEVLAPDLLAHLDSLNAAWDVREEKHDWLLVERLIRNFMTTQGCAFPTRKIMGECQDQYALTRPTFPIPDKSEYARRFAFLKTEHEFSDE